MHFWSLPPAARSKLWLNCVRARDRHLVLRAPNFTASLLSTKGQLQASLNRRHSTATNEYSFWDSPEDSLWDDLNEPPLGWDPVLATVRKALRRVSRPSTEVKDAFVENLQWCLKNKSRFSDSSAVARFRQRLKEATAPTARFSELQEIVDSTIPHLLENKLKEKFAHAPPLMFKMERIAPEFRAFCDQIKLQKEIKMEVSPQEAEVGTLPISGSFVARLHLRLPGITKEKSIGYGPNKRIATQKAWMAMLIRMDTTEVLPEVFSSLLSNEEIDLDNLDETVLKRERNGLTDIYNYAAKYGLVPDIETREVKRRIRGNPSYKAHLVAQVSIKLPELNLDVCSYGSTGLQAIAKAARESRRQIEEFHAQSDQHLDADEYLSALDTTTAADFVRTVGDIEGHFHLDFEEKTIPFHGATIGLSQLMLNGEPVGKRATVRVKRNNAHKVAYLTAAIELARKRPDILTQFVVNLRARTPRSLGQSGAVATTLEAKSLAIMERTLVHAGEAGLFEYPETVTAMSRPVESFRRHLYSQGANRAKSWRLLKDLERFDKDPDTERLREARASLPMNQHLSEVLDLVSGNVYSIIIGATGSGKTTQVPQIILDDAIRRSEGGSCNVICTQPRRLATTSVARRVATERGETLGNTVGYRVRGDSEPPQLGGSITYCTTGTLLERLKWNPDDVMDRASHLVIDEVHERDIFIDFLLIVLKRAITTRQKAGKTVPKVVLMSATMDKALFSAYLPNEVNGRSTPCPTLEVPGRLFPVKEKYLGEILKEITEKHPKEIRRFLARDRDDSSDYLEAEKAFEFNNPSGEADVDDIEWRRLDLHANLRTGKAVESLVPIALLVATIAHICENNSGDGAILAFLPGFQEISAAEELLKEGPVFGIDFRNQDAFRIHSLHSMVPAKQQREIFEPLPAGCRRIILSTNIAETSITVPDVKHIVDLGKLRQKRYAHAERISALLTVWGSNSNARQRAGRAGRVSDGTYYALYSRKRRAAMPASGLPELLRTDLQAICLSVKAQGFEETVSNFLSAAIEPPNPAAVQFAVENLQAIEALTKDEKVTALGAILAKLPVHPMLGKMILLGLIFRCLDPMILIASMHGERSLFADPIGDTRKLARETKQHFNVAESDHLTALKGYQDLREISHESDMRSVIYYARERFLHMGAYRVISHTAEQVEQTLIEAGLLEANEDGKTDPIGGSALNRNSNNIGLIKCLILAGVYPNLSAKTNLRSPRSRSFRTGSERDIIHHGTSVNYVRPKADDEVPAHSMYAFTTLARASAGDTLFMRDSTRVHPLAVLLFGGRLEANREENEVLVDGWLPFDFSDDADPGRAIDAIMRFRDAKDRMLNVIFRLLSDPNETATVVDVMEIMTNGLVELLDADPEGRGKEKPLSNRYTRNVNGDIPQEIAWSNIYSLYRSKSLADMEDL